MSLKIKIMAIVLCIGLYVHVSSGEQINKSNAKRAVPCYMVTDYDAVGNGKTKDAQAIQKAMDVAHTAGGGMVYFPASKYLTGAIILKTT